MQQTKEQDRVLKAIEALIESQLNPVAKVKVQGFFMMNDEQKIYAQIDFVTGWEKYRPKIQSPPIPLHGLIPAKVWSCARWIIAGLKPQHPDWFLDYLEPVTPELIKDVLDKHLKRLERQDHWTKAEQNEKILAAMDLARIEMDEHYERNNGGLDRGQYLYLLQLGLHEHCMRLFGSLEGKPKRWMNLSFPTLSEIIESNRQH